MRFVFSLLMLLVCFSGSSQNLAAFSDYQNRFFVFDDGKIRQLEHLPIVSFETGDNAIGYLTNSSNFKVYYNHIDYDVALMISSYQVSNHLVIYNNGSQLYVFDDGKKMLLSKYATDFLAGDSLVAFYDTFEDYFQVYYNGRIITLEDDLLYENISLFKVGQNILAYIDAYQNFKVFYRGELIEMMKTNVIPIFELGRNIMAFIDPLTDYFQVFFNNELITIEPFKPKSFQAGYEKVAYITNTGDFKLFENGETYTISTFEPDMFLLKDNMLIYHQQEQIFAFYKGENYLVENYIPASYKINDNAIAYLDQNGFLQLFKEGNHINLSYERINDFEVLRNVVIYNEGMNTTKIYYKGKTISQ